MVLGRSAKDVEEGSKAITVFLKLLLGADLALAAYPL